MSNKDNIETVIDPGIDWVTTYINSIEYKDDTLDIKFNAVLMTFHPLFQNHISLAPDCGACIEYHIIFSDVKSLMHDDKCLDSFSWSIRDADAEDLQLYDLKFVDNRYVIEFYEWNPLVVESNPPENSFGKWIQMGTFLDILGPNIDWSASEIADLELNTDLILNLKVVLYSWHPRFEKNLVRGHKGAYSASLRFPNVTAFGSKPQMLIENGHKQTISGFQIEIEESESAYLIKIHKGYDFIKVKVESDPPVFEIEKFLESSKIPPTLIE